jgi:hypothetical protein
MVWRIVAITALGFAGYRVAARRKRRIHAAFSDTQPQDPNATVRDAGPEAMRDGDRENWTMIDEELDQTFPASDPPANY